MWWLQFYGGIACVILGSLGLFITLKTIGRKIRMLSLTASTSGGIINEEKAN
jgi:hypothetical protein